MNRKLLHFFVGGVLVILLLTLAGLLPFWVPMMTQVPGLLLIATLMIVWAGFILTEQSHDEREMTLTMRSGRIAYLSGLIVLTIALVTQGLHSTIDPWVCSALAAMIVSKFVARAYLE